MKVFVALTALLAVASAGHLGLTPYSYPGLVHAHYTGAHYAGAHHIPVIGANGVPVDEPAVAIAKASHAAAHVEAAVRNGDVAHVGVAPVAAYAAHVAAPVAHYAGPQHLPVIGANGVPVDEPAVSAARAHHAAAHVEAAVRNGDAAVVAAGPVAYAAGHFTAPVVHYAGPQHLPVIGANGVPVDEPAVSAARAHHAAAHVEAKVRNGDAAILAAPVAYAAGHIAAPVAAYAAHVAAPAVPLDTAEVAAAKAAHFAAHIDAKVRNGAFHHFAPLVHYRKRRGVFHGYGAAPFAAYAAPVAHFAGAHHVPVIGANGVPVDEPAVAIAKASHAAAHVEAAVRNGDVAHFGVAPVAAYAAHVAAPVVHYAGPQHLPVIGANGVPVDEPAVSAARASHAAAHVEAAVRNGDAAVVAAAPVAAYAAHVAAPVAHYAGPQHLPVIGANGVPVDEPAVSAARAHHAAAHVEAKVRNGDAAVVAAGPFAFGAGHFAGPVAYAAGHIAAPVVHYAGAHHVPVIGANGVPVDEPAVAVARAHHAAAHIEAKVRNGDLHHLVAPVVHAY